MHWGKGALVFLAVAAPWFLAVAGTDQKLWKYFLLREVVKRVASDVQHRSKPFWYFLPVLLGGFVPWTPLLLSAWRVLREEADRRRDFVRMCAGWAVLGLVMFSASKSKMPTYILPLIPPLAILVGLTVARTMAGSPVPWLRGCLIASAGVVLGVIVAVTIGVHKVYKVDPRDLLWLDVIIGLGCVTAIARAAWGHLRDSVLLLLIMMGVFAMGATLVLPKIEAKLTRQTTAKYFCQRIRAADPQGKLPVVSYQTFLCGVPFYLQRLVLWHRQDRPNVAPAADDTFEYSNARGDEAKALLNDQQFKELWQTGQRVFCIIAKKHLPLLQEEVNVPLHQLEVTGDWLLVSNVP
jgi:4-amino-4-deoxy-L-arabinose transferase-like glycosyltransferase